MWLFSCCKFYNYHQSNFQFKLFLQFNLSKINNHNRSDGQQARFLKFRNQTAKENINKNHSINII